MSERTENREWLPWILSATIVFAIIMATVVMDWHRYMVTPWQIATKVAVETAISEFSLKNITEGIYQAEFYKAMVGMGVLLIFGPAFWIIGEIRSEENGKPSHKGFYWYIGTVLVLLGLVTGIVGSVKTAEILHYHQDNLAKEKKTQKMYQHLNLIAFDLYEYYHLPKTYNGGGGSYKAFADSGKAALRFLENYSDTLSYDFVVEKVDADSSITLYMVGNTKGINPDFKNINGEKGYVQRSVSVYPTYDENTYNYNNQNIF